MALFPERFVNQVQQATDIVDVVGQYVALKKRGKEFLGLCPFHEDHRPSMNVSPAKQIFKCFACGAGGGVFQFLMQLQKLSFPEAVKQLAERAGIPLPTVETPAGYDSSLSSEVLVKVTTFAARWFRDRLNAPEGQAALEYARGRKLSEESIRRFGLGYAPDAWDAFGKAAVKNGFSDRQLVAAGMLIQRDDGSGYDRFRNRLMFPILDVTGKVIAFGGRALAADEQAKYLNSSETAIFDKSANLYALNWSREGISRSGQAVVVEGYLDALMPLQAGLDNVVATLGTSLTDRHVRLLARYAREVVLVFDADTAGQAASERAIELFLSQRLNVRVATVPEAGPDGSPVKDPCDYVLAAGAEALRRVLADAPDALEFAWSRRQEAYRQAQTLAQKRTILEEFLTLLASSAVYGAIDALRQGLLAGRVAELVGLSPAEISQQIRRLGRRHRAAALSPRAPGPSAPGGSENPARQGVAVASPAVRAERWLLGALLNAPGLFAAVSGQVDPSMFTDPFLRAVARRVWELGSQERLELMALLRAEESPRWGELVTDLQAEGENHGNHEQTAADACREMLRRRRQEELETMKYQADAGAPEVLRQISRHAALPDQRRHPKIT